MAWYYYAGKAVRSIQVKPGLSFAVRPHTKVEILEETTEARALIRKGELRRTGKVAGATPVSDIPVPEQKVEDVMEKSLLARKFAEKGKTTAPSIPPKSKNAQEMTEDEIRIREIVKDGQEGPGVDAGPVVVEPVPQEDEGEEAKVEDVEELPVEKKSKRKVRRR